MQITDLLFLRKAHVYFFDLDGCIYHTDEPATGAEELLELLRRDGKKVGFITNNSCQSASEIAEKLLRMGFRIRPEEIITATDITGFYLKERYGTQTVKVVGSKSLASSIGQWGHTVIDLAASDKAEVVVIGRDTEFTFDKLQQIIELEGAGARVVASNPDLFHPGPQGKRIPETGALVAAVEAIINKQVEHAGKPSTTMFNFGMRLYGVEPHQCIMVGDNLYTDIAGGIQAGMKTVWIRGAGMNQSLSDSDLTANKPNMTINRVKELLSSYISAG